MFGSSFVARTLLSLAFSTSAFCLQLPIRINTWDGSPEIREISLPVSEPVDRIYLQVHGLRFGGQLSVRVNDAAWTHVYNNSVELHPNERKHQGIGGIYSTIRLFLPGDGLISGQSNRLYFRFNGIDGFTTGLRIIDLDFLDADGASVMSENSISQENPAEWSGPYTPEDVGGAEKIEAGRVLWGKRDLLFEDFLTKQPIRASCADCHFDDGSDLKYFNFANETIIARSRFHGLSEEQGKQIASYIRNIDLGLPAGMEAPGRPWNPPFQPGPGTDPVDAGNPNQLAEAGARWLAGRGLEAVKDSDEAVYEAVFTEGSGYSQIAEMMDTMATLSMREIPLTIQFPDWNQWLPRVAPVDIWPDDVLLRDVRVSQGDENNEFVNPPIDLSRFSSPDIPLWQGPEDLFRTLESQLEGNGKNNLANAGMLNRAFGDFTSGVVDHWYGVFRSSDKALDEIWQATLANSSLSYDEMRAAILKWRLVKATYLVRDFDLETLNDAATGDFSNANAPYYAPEPLSFPSKNPRGAAWALAPHISAQNTSNLDEQEYRVGKANSNQWYLLQQVFNTGYRRSSNMNVPLDWAYVRLHLNAASDATGHDYSTATLFSQIKMAQSRRMGVGIKKSGFSMRTASPNFFFSKTDLRWDNYRKLNDLDPGLWNRFFEEYLYELLDVVGSYDINASTGDPNAPFRDDDDRNTINTAGDLPRPWLSGNTFLRPDEDFLTNTYRILPFLMEQSINPAVLEDWINWLSFAFPKNANWDNPPLEISDPNSDGVIEFPTIPYWDELIQPASNYLYLENFENGSANGYNGAFSLITHKDPVTRKRISEDVHPRSGGGIYFGRRGLNTNSTEETVRNINSGVLDIPVSPGQRLRISMRTAFKLPKNTPIETVQTRMRVTFDAGGTLDGETVFMNSALFKEKFETYEDLIVVPPQASKIVGIQVRWTRSAGGNGQGYVYLDNVMVQDADPIVYPNLTMNQIPDMRSTSSKSDGDSIAVRWNEPADMSNILGWKIYRWVEKADPNDNSEEISLTSAPISLRYRDFDDYTVDRGITYRYRMSAIGKNGDEVADLSDHVPGTLNSTVPNIPMRHEYLKEIDGGGVRISWFGVPDIDAEGYRVYRRETDNLSGSWTRIDSSTVRTLHYEDLSAISGVSYDYYVSPFTTGKGRFNNSANLISFDPSATAAERANPTELVAYVDFDGGVNDAAGNLIFDVGDPTNIELGAGVIGDAYRVTRNSDRIRLEDNELLNSGDGYPRRTVALWFKLDSIGGPQTIYEEGGFNVGIHIYMVDDTLYAGAYNAPDGWEGTWRKLSGVTAGEWHHLALVIDADVSPDAVAADQFFAYFNGVEFDPGNSLGMRLRRHVDNGAIGSTVSVYRTHDGSNSDNMLGLVDEFILWNRALTHAEVAALAGQSINYTLDSFRSQYLLASDGSDDYRDWSGDGISNIAYYHFGLGDPRQSGQMALQRGGTPMGGFPIVEPEDANTLAYSYVRNKMQNSYEYRISKSSDLESWQLVENLPVEDRPSREAEIQDIDGTYEIVTEFFDMRDVDAFYRTEVLENY
ncbi:MAG: LamG-like jellyroll fold domain-containing protein [Opitutales bacterium]